MTNNKPAATLRELLERQARTLPDATAIRAPGRSSLTYSGLLRCVNYIHNTLCSDGIRRNDRVAIVLPNGAEAAVAFLGVGSYCAGIPLSTEHKQDEFDYFLSRLNARAIIVQRGSDARVIPIAQDKDILIVELIPDLENAAGSFSLKSNNPNPIAIDNIDQVQPSDIALLLFTSGTTSSPKLVPLTHWNICNSIYNISKSLELTEYDSCLNVMPLYHAHAIFTPLLASIQTGGAIVCTPGFNDKQFFSWLFEEKATWYSAVPTIHQSIVKAYKQHKNRRISKSLRFIRSASSSLPPAVYNELREIFNVPVIEAYGLSEAASVVTSNPMPPKNQKIGSVGLRMGTDVEIVSEDGKLLPANQVGEIVIKGASVMSAYENADNEIEEKKYIDKWFKTGDLGYFDEEEYLFIVGRTKEVINRGGKKVTPLEVDNMCVSHPLIEQAVTFAVFHPTLGEDVVTAIIPHEGAEISDLEVRRYLSMTLADFKVPSQIIFVEEIPKSSTGKIHRNELASLFKDRLRIQFVLPRDETEIIISNVWTQVLGVDRVGIDDNFFGLGGDSLLLAQVHDKISDLLSIEISIVDLFEYPTIRSLVNYLQNRHFVSSHQEGDQNRKDKIEQGKLRFRKLLSKNKRDNN